MNRSTPGLPVNHQLPEFTQTHVHQVSDAIQPSHPLSSPSAPVRNPSQDQGLFQWVNSSHEVAKVLEFWLQHQSFQWTPRTHLPYDGLLGSPCCPKDSKASSPTPQFKSIDFSVLGFLHSPTLTSIYDHWKNHSLDLTDLCGKAMSLLFNMLYRLVITFLPKSKPLNFMAAITICSDSEAEKCKVGHCFHCFPIYFPWSDETRCHDLSFLSFKPTFSLSSFTFIKRLFIFSSLSAIIVVSSTYLRWLIFLPVILISVCDSSSPGFLMMYSTYKLNKQGDNIQPWCTPFPIWNQSVPCPVLTLASWPERMWSTGEGNGRPLQYSCLENPMNSMKRQIDRILKEELPRSVGAQYANGGQWRNNSRNKEEMEPKQIQYSHVDVTGDRSKAQSCKRARLRRNLES